MVTAIHQSFYSIITALFINKKIGFKSILYFFLAIINLLTRLARLKQILSQKIWSNKQRGAVF